MTKQPPVTLRVPAETRVAVEKLATSRGIPKNAAYVELIQRGLRAAGAKSLASIPKTDAPALRKAAHRKVSITPDAARVTVSVPLHQPKPFNPQPKRGKK
jgi:hypothetical protein